jgi:hypothetical protein
MATGSPTFRPRSGSDRLTHGAWGVQPSGPLFNVAQPTAPLIMGRGTPTIPSGPGSGPGGLPGKDLVDYVHSLTQTSLLLLGLAAFLILHRGRGVTAFRRLAGKVV